jgi:outer membrane receptor protein involved in Fe transport
MNKIVVLITLIFLSFTTMAQGIKIEGNLRDEKNNAVSFATVNLMDVKNQKAIAGAQSNENGQFTILLTTKGLYALKINTLGYSNYTSANILVTSLDTLIKIGSIKLKQQSKNLNVVEVKAEKSMMQMDIDKRVFNVEKNTTTSGGSAADVLQNVPSVAVDLDGNVSLRGKGNVTILIDGRPSTMLGSDVAAALQSLSANSIESVEVITNPSSKYDAQGMSGIINIITKRDKKFGLNGVGTIGIGTLNKYNGSVNLNLKNNKWNVFLNANGRINNTYNYATINRSNKNDVIRSDSYEDNDKYRFGGMASMGAEYTFSKQNVVMFTQSLNRMRFGSDANTRYEVYNGSLQTLLQDRHGNFDGGPISTTSALNFKHKFKQPKQEITADLSYSHTWMKREQDYATTTTNFLIMPPMNIVSQLNQNAPGQGNMNNFTGMIDYTMPMFHGKGKLDAGLKTQISHFDNSNTPTKNYGDPTYTTTDTSMKSDYNYNMRIDAAYINMANTKGKWGYQAGLRLENATYRGTTNIYSVLNYENNFLNLFPTTYISYQVSPNQTFYLSYSRRTNRPGFRDMMPFLDLSNPQDSSMGNPNLKPEFIHNAELNYNKQFEKGHQLMFSTYYQYTENLIEKYRVFYSDGTSFTQPQNLNKGETFGAELTGKLQISKPWDASFNFNLFKTNIINNVISQAVNTNGTSWFTKVNTTYKLNQGNSIQLNANYEAPKVTAQGRTQEVYWIDLAYKANFWNSKGSVTLSISDILNTRKYTNIYDYSNYYQVNYRDRETRIANVTFTYRIGKSDPKALANKRGRVEKSQNTEDKKVKSRDNLMKEGDDNNEGGGEQPKQPSN